MFSLHAVFFFFFLRLDVTFDSWRNYTNVLTIYLIELRKCKVYKASNNKLLEMSKVYVLYKHKSVHQLS